jgi:plastocyanin
MESIMRALGMVWLSLGLAAAPATAMAEYTGGPVSNGGTITGKVTLSGARPVLPPKARDRNPDICGSSGPDESLLVSDSGAVKNAVVYLQNVKTGKPLTTVTADFDQKGCTYTPHVLAVPVGSTVNILNSDATLHNVDALLEGGTVFNYAMPSTLKKIPKRLSKPGFAMVKCDVHAWMSGYIGVMENPYFAVTGEDGSFKIDNVPPGTYSLAVWHEAAHAPAQSVTVAAGGQASAAIKLTK